MWKLINEKFWRFAAIVIIVELLILIIQFGKLISLIPSWGFH